MRTHECGTGKHAKMADCRECYNAYMRVYLAKRYQDRRNMCIENLGGKCVECGSENDLEFDHKDRTTKSDTIAKCQLLCSECHLRKTGTEIGVPHGGGMKGKRNCKCSPCVLKRREYARNLRRKSVGV